MKEMEEGQKGREKKEKKEDEDETEPRTHPPPGGSTLGWPGSAFPDPDSVSRGVFISQ